MTEEGTIRGPSILRYCSTCKNNMWHKIDMCGKCGTTNTTKHKERCRCCGGLFDSLVQDHPGLQGQCEICVENYEKEKQVSSDRYACAGCEKYFHELDLSKDKDGNLLCAPCSHAYDAGRVPARAEMCCDCGVAEVDPPPRCDACWGKDFQERHKSAALEPDNSHYTRGDIEPWTYIQANDLNFFEGSAVKYITRWRHKNGLDDLRKARVYIDELIRQEEEK